MTKEEAEVMASKMTYRNAVNNALQGRAIPYRKATKAKLYELLKMLEKDPPDDMVHVETLHQNFRVRDNEVVFLCPKT